MEEKYRTIKKSNPAFSRRLGAVTGGSDLLLASGFDIETREEGVEYYVLVPDADKWPRLVAAREGIGRALTEASNTGGGGGGGTTTNGAWNGVGAPPAANNGAGMFPGGMPGGGMPPAGGPDMSALQSMMNDPNMMQNALGMMNVSAFYTCWGRHPPMLPRGVVEHYSSFFAPGGSLFEERFRMLFIVEFFAGYARGTYRIENALRGRCICSIWGSGLCESCAIFPATGIRTSCV